MPTSKVISVQIFFARVLERFFSYSWFVFIYRFFKVFTRWMTRTHEIERILTRSRTFQTSMVWELLAYFRRSRSYQMLYPQLIRTPDLKVSTIELEILKAKQIRYDTSSCLYQNLHQCLLCITSWNEIIRDLNEISIQRFNAQNQNHQHSLLQFWELMIGTYEKKLSCLQKTGEKIKDINIKSDPRWELVGFQGKTPQSDFRGLDILSLRNMLWFVQIYKPYSRSILYETHKNDRGNNWFSYFITGIHLVFDTYRSFTGYDINEYTSSSSSLSSPRKIKNAWNPNNTFVCEWYLRQFAIRKNGVFLKRYEVLRDKLLDKDDESENKHEEEEEEKDQSQTYTEEFFQEFQYDCDDVTDLRLSVVSQFFSSYYVWFHEYWKKAKPASIMEFNIIHKACRKTIEDALENDKFSILRDRNEQDDLKNGILIKDEKAILEALNSVYLQYNGNNTSE